jgi:hypothetical protein
MACRTSRLAKSNFESKEALLQPSQRNGMLSKNKEQDYCCRPAEPASWDVM